MVAWKPKPNHIVCGVLSYQHAINFFLCVHISLETKKVFSLQYHRQQNLIHTWITTFFLVNPMLQFLMTISSTGKWSVNPFPNNPWFLPVYSTSLLKTLWGKAKLLLTSNFSFSCSFLPIWRAFCHFYQTWYCCLQTIPVWKSLKFGILERVKSLNRWPNCSFISKYQTINSLCLKESLR